MKLKKVLIDCLMVSLCGITKDKHYTKVDDIHNHHNKHHDSRCAVEIL